MFSSKKDIDRHVKTSLNKLPENERYLRGLVIARQYFKLNEYASAEHWLSCYLSVQEDSAPAHKLLGQCYEKQRKYDRAVTSYQRSLQLDSKQTGLITDVCKLLLADDNLSKNLAKAKHWCDLAESERINHEAVLNLKLKVANKDTNGSDQPLVKDIILREIIARPLEPALRVRLVDHFLEERKLDEAFKYCFDLEMKFSETFLQSTEWTNGVAKMLSKYTESTTGDGVTPKNWHYYLLQAIVLDRQIYLNLLADSTMESIKRSNMKEIAHRLYDLDQTLRQVADKGRNAAPQTQLADEYLRHYRGQLLLYSASLLFKGAQDATAGSGSVRARDTTRKCLALLLLAYQCGVPNPDEVWLKQSSEVARQVMAFWNKQAAFRCCQAGATVLSCVDESMDASVLAQIQSVTESKVWTTVDDLMNQIRQLCSDAGWRKTVFRSLHPFGDSGSKASAASYFVQNGAAFGEPQYVLPKREEIDLHLELAQSLFPSSLSYLVYLGLAMGTENLADLRCRAFPRLNFSTNNLDNCNLETLNQLDMDSFLYCSILVARSNLDSERHHQQHRLGTGTERPGFLPAANLIPLLCEENKIDWWSTAYHLIRSSTAKDAALSVAEQKQLLQHGLQAVRGTGAPLSDAIVLLHLGQILAKRAIGSGSLLAPEERRHVEGRAEAVYRAGVLLWKIRSESSAPPASTMFFRYGFESYECQQETVKLAETAVTFLAGTYFKHGRHLEFSQDFAGIALPFAAYFRAEAFKKLDESNHTPLKVKKMYAERARECIRQTQQYLGLPYVDRNHPLNHVVQSEMKRLCFANDSLDGTLNTSANGAGAGDESDHFQSFTSAVTVGGNGSSVIRSERETVTAVATAAATACLSKTSELESLIRQMMETLTFVKEDVLSIRNDMGDMQDRLVKIEENIYRKPTEAGASKVGGGGTVTGGDDPATVSVTAAAAAAALQAMNDMYLMDELQNSAAAAAVYHHQVQAAAGRTPGMGLSPQPALPYAALYGAAAYPAYLAQQTPPSHQLQSQHQQSPAQQQQLLTSRGPLGVPVGASPLHGYQQPEQLLAAANSQAAAVASAYHSIPPNYPQPPLVVPPVMPPVGVAQTSTPNASLQKGPGGTGGAGGLSIEQSLQTPSLLTSWNSAYNGAPATFTNPSVPGPITPPATVSSHHAHHAPAEKGGAPVNVVITSSDPLPPRGPPAHSSSFAAGGSVTQPTYSVTIPPQHIKHSATGGSIGQGTTAASTAKLEAISPPMAKPLAATAAAANNNTSSPSFFAQAVSSSPTVKSLLAGGGSVNAGANNNDDDDDDAKNISGSVEYDPRPDFQPIIPLPDEIVVRTGEEDEEQIFTGRSKLLRLVDREWKERGLGELKILRSKTDLAKYRIVMRREQIHKICANHYITPELIIKPMEKRKECYIWAAMDFADEEPRKESFCARFGTAELAKQFHDAFVAARDEVARLRASDPGAAGGPPAAAQPPPATVPTSFAFSAPKSAGTVGKATTATTVAAATTKKDPVAPFGEFTFAKNYTPPTVVTGTKGTGVSEPAAAQGGASKPSPFASFTFKAQTTGASTVEGISFGSGGTAGGGVAAASSKPPTSGFGDVFKPKSGTWDCSGCYVNNKADATHCLACNGPRDPSKPDEGSAGKPKGGLFDNLATAGGGSKFTFGMPQPVGTPPAPITFGVAPGAVTKKPPVELDSAKTTTAAAAATGFGDKFKPRPGAWTCGGCYLSNGADVLYCASCESPKDDTVPKKSADVGGLLKAADTMPKFNFTAGGGFTFGVPATAGLATTGTSSVPSSTTTSAQPAPPVFGSAAGSEGFTFGAGASPLKPPRGLQPSSEPVAKPVFKFELPTPAGGLSFGSKLTAPMATEKAPTAMGVETMSPASKVEPPEKATFGFVFKPKSPGRTLSTSSGGGGAADGTVDDGTGGAGGDSSITEEENNTYFAPVIALPDKVDVKTGEEDEDVLYSHRAKLYRFVSSEWKERGIGDVKILKHKTTGKLRMIMRREQVLKICLNHALTEDVCYSKKDDKSWQFVANDFSEGTFELMNFCLRFKSVDIAQEFRDAITDALSGKLTQSGGKASPGTVVVPGEPRDSTINTTTSPSGDFNFSKLSDISLNERETLEKLKLPANFLDAPAVACSGCRGCDVEAFTFPVVDGNKLTNESPDDSPLPIDIRNVAPLPSQHSTPKKAVSFGAAPVAGVGNLFGSLTFGVPPTTTEVTGGLQLPASTTTSSFLVAEQKVSGTMKPSLTPFLAPNTIFGGGQPAVAGAAPVIGAPTSEAGGANKLIFGSSQSGVGSASDGSGGSIFSASLNTTPKTSFVPAPPSSTAVAGPTETSSTTTEEDKSASDVDATTNTPTPLIQQAALSTPSPADAGGKLFGAISFGGGTTTPAPFGSISSSTKSIFGGTTTTTPSTATSPSNLFGSVVFGGSGDSTPKSIFGGSVGTGPNAFSFGGPAKLPEGKVASTFITPTAKDAPPVLTMDGGVSFADLASSSPSGFGSFKKFDDAKTGSAGFVGLTVKEDFFSRSAASKLNSSADGARNNGNVDADGTGAAGGGVGETAGDENYDPYYAPVIQLPDEIEVRTGEEEETKLFGDRAKLYRYDSDTKEWKERGVGELKILHHPVRNTYRLLLRREQIYKLVLNHAISADLAVTSMNNSGKAFVWGALNHADGPPQLEKLAVRFKNETIADEFRRMLESCQEKLRSRPDLEPDQD